MKIFAIMLVKNEADIVASVLKDAQKWADKIFILDNGSTDGTWEIIQSMKNDIITPWKQYFGQYHNGLRAEVFNEFKHLSEPGDWWCFKLDADEFYVDNPRDFLPTIPKNCQMVGKASIDYEITKEDEEEYTFTGDFEKDKDKIKYFHKKLWCEGRFFKYRKGLKWTCDPKNHYPEHIGVQAEKLILVRHYQHRSPQQVEKRTKLRMETEVFKKGTSWRLPVKTWEEAKALLTKTRRECIYDDGDIEKIRQLEVDYGKFYQSPLKKFIKRVLIFLHLYN